MCHCISLVMIFDAFVAAVTSLSQEIPTIIGKLPLSRQLGRVEFVIKG